ncbi:hypothetical protein [Telmatospirillum sp.]|uniref:hypothetical protein n=1 Tax=Telmatospirillum sp. TaxID=2079197 RepID=UPI0028461544|nr:hypothetical protein [Telmatospirillum sp.]MDR3436445.1 hypothetical protein [Telmatospirillum sp.]
MRVTLEGSKAHILAARKAAYLKAWPISAQLEAHADAAAGRPEKLNKMLADFTSIKNENPV